MAMGSRADQVMIRGIIIAQGIGCLAFDELQGWEEM
jgi:hypothetical protein